MIAWPIKDPDEVADYTMTFQLDEGDSISSETVQVSSGSVVVDSKSSSGAVVTVWLSGGVADELKIVSVRVVTSGGRTFDQFAAFFVAERNDALAAQFRLRFPSFAAVTDSIIYYWLTMSASELPQAFGDQQDLARLLWAAHMLTLEGYGTSVEAQRQNDFGGANRVKSGSLELAWPTIEADLTDLVTSKYGKQIRALAKSHQGGPRVTRTGAFPPVVTYGNS